MRVIHKRLTVGILSTALLFCQVNFSAMASTKETIMKTATVETTVYEQVEPGEIAYTAKLTDDIHQLKQGGKMPAITLGVGDTPSVYASEEYFNIYIWVLDENKQSFAFGRLPDGKSYEPGFLMGAGGMPTHEKLNKHGVTTINLPRNTDNKYQYYTVGDISYGDEKRKIYDDRHPILTLPEEKCILKIELALWRQGHNKFTFIRPGDADYPDDPLNPEEKTNPTKTFKGFVGNGTNGMEGVTIIARHPQANHTKSTTTNAVGEYRIELDEVKFGTIHLTAEIDGRKLQTSDGKEYHPITFYAADTTKNYDFGDPTASREYAIKMIGGTANPTKAVKDTTVSISAGAPSSCKRFKRWVSSDNITFADGKAEITTFKMPARNVTITAEFETVSEDGSTDGGGDGSTGGGDGSTGGGDGSTGGGDGSTGGGGSTDGGGGSTGGGSGSTGGGDGSSSGGGGSTGGGSSSGGGGSSSSGGGGSSSGGGSSGGGGVSSGGRGGSGPAAAGQGTIGTKLIGNVRVPDYITEGNWIRTASGTWTFSGIGGQNYANTWVAAFNPYANVTMGQQAFDWFAFDGGGNMVTGWYAAADGNTYYLNPNSDNTLGAMKTGWVLIEGRYYYFNEISDGTRGKLFRNTKTPDGYFVDGNGIWDGKGL